MEPTIQDWHWLVFGIALIVAEIFIPSFVVLWFGLGAIIVAACLWLSPALSLSLQLLIWAIASIIFTVLWFKYFKPTMIDRTKAGIAREAIVGESGTVIKIPSSGQRGVIRFTTPILGAEEWQFVCNEDVAAGDRVYVKDVSGNTLIVTKTQAPAAQ